MSAVKTTTLTLTDAQLMAVELGLEAYIDDLKDLIERNPDRLGDVEDWADRLVIAEQTLTLVQAS
jgi:hypothetical protein